MESLWEMECVMMKQILKNVFTMEGIVAQVVSTQTSAQNACAMKKVHFYQTLHVCILFLLLHLLFHGSKYFPYILILNSCKSNLKKKMVQINLCAAWFFQQLKSS